MRELSTALAQVAKRAAFTKAQEANIGLASSSPDRSLPCPICGDEVCRCADDKRPLPGRSSKKRFVPDSEAHGHDAARLVDPEAYDATEQQFAASLEQTHRPARRFVVEEVAPEPSKQENIPVLAASSAPGAKPGVSIPQRTAHPPASPTEVRSEAGTHLPQPVPTTDTTPKSEAAAQKCGDQIPPSGSSGQEVLAGHHDLAAWRQEVAERLGRYQARRGAQESRYPSLRLKFESEPTPSKDSAAPEGSTVPSFADGATSAAAAKRAPAPPAGESGAQTAPDATRVIHFPRPSATSPPQPLNELAEPVLDRPRIVEAPEVAPVPPALGGMLIEAEEEPKHDRRPGFEIPLRPASMSVRMFAAGLDMVLVVFAAVLFGYVFFSMVDVPVPRGTAVVCGFAFGVIFWAGYQYLLLVYSGTTPGLQLAGLRLSRFDDTPASQRSRRWRALASVLSLLSLGLGYAWCFLDEDQLCWHDRITGTYLSPQAPD